MRQFCPMALFLVALTLGVASPTHAQIHGADPASAPGGQHLHPTWESANSALSVELDSTDIGALAKRALMSPAPQDAAAWLRRLALLVRADYRQDVLAMLLSRPTSLTADGHWGLSALASDCVRYHDPQIAFQICALFSEEMYSPEIIDGALVTLPADRIDAWLAKGDMQGSGEWYAARIRRRARQKTEGPLIAAEEKRIRSHPDDGEAIDRYLQAIRICRQANRPYDLRWLGLVCRPKLAIEAFILGGNIGNVGGDPAPLYLRALQTKFTAQDAIWYRDYTRRMRFASAVLEPPLTAPQLRNWTQTALMNAYQAQGEHAKAQALLETLTAENKEGLPDPYQAFGVGQIQAGSGARVVERRIVAAETKPENQASPEYWLERGLYYSGRSEDAPAVKAFEQALKLAPLPTVDGPINLRWDIVQAYRRHLWLRNIDHPTDMFALLNRELDLAPPASSYAEALFQNMASFRSESIHPIDYKDPRVWAFLSAQPDWSHFVSLLRTLSLSATGEQEDRVWKRLSELSRGAPTSRAYALGEMEVLWGDAARAIPVLEEALPRATSEQPLWELLSTLWSARSKLHDWKGMEALLRKSPPVGNVLEIANAAAASGANAEAMRYFQIWINQDRRRFAEFTAMQKPGIKPLLRAYFLQLKSDEPHCATPDRALQ